MILPIEIGTVASGLISGTCFGVALEGAGFASPCKLTAQLRFKDWAVFNVMFTAIIVAAAGLYILQLTGLMSTDEMFIPTTYFWATLAGGAFVGIGMSVGGYCPGTSVVGFCSGRVDAFFFFGGLILGPILFAGIYDRLLPMLRAAKGPDAQTVPQLLHLPPWAILLAMIAIAVGVAWWSKRQDAAQSSSETRGDFFRQLPQQSQGEI